MTLAIDCVSAYRRTAEQWRENVKTGAVTLSLTRSTLSNGHIRGDCVALCHSIYDLYINSPIGKWFKPPHSQCGVTGSNPVGTPNSKTKVMDSDTIRLIKKMEANAFYPTFAESVLLCASKEFRFYDKKVAEEIAKSGKKEMRKLLSKFKLKK